MTAAPAAVQIMSSCRDAVLGTTDRTSTSPPPHPPPPSPCRPCLCWFHVLSPFAPRALVSLRRCWGHLSLRSDQRVILPPTPTPTHPHPPPIFLQPLPSAPCCCVWAADHWSSCGQTQTTSPRHCPVCAES